MSTVALKDSRRVSEEDEDVTVVIRKDVTIQKGTDVDSVTLEMLVNVYANFVGRHAIPVAFGVATTTIENLNLC